MIGVLIAGMADALGARPADADPVRDARLSRASQRCAQLAELISCDEALALAPQDAAALTAEADALVVQQRPGEAIGVYRRALRLAPQQAVVSAKITAAEAQRRTRLKTCMTQGGEVGRHACDAAWLPGTPDEANLFKRRGFLLRGEDPLAALDAYMAAARLRPRDRDVARALIGLTDGSAPRRDPATLAARGAAFIVLGRRGDAMAPLRAAVDLAPTLATARVQLRLAHRSAAGVRTARRAARRATPPTRPSADGAALAKRRDRETGLPAAGVPDAAAGVGVSPAGIPAGDVPDTRFSNDAPAGRTN